MIFISNLCLFTLVLVSQLNPHGIESTIKESRTLSNVYMRQPGINVCGLGLEEVTQNHPLHFKFYMETWDTIAMFVHLCEGEIILVSCYGIRSLHCRLPSRGKHRLPRYAKYTR